MFADLVEEILEQRSGARVMAEALLRRWLILLLRKNWQDAEHPPCWLTTLEDRRLGRALTTMLDRPAHAFTVDGLAETAGMSRLVFAARFTAAVGRSPMEFLTTVRLERAAHLLAGSDLPQLVHACLRRQPRNRPHGVPVPAPACRPRRHRSSGGGSDRRRPRPDIRDDRYAA